MADDAGALLVRSGLVTAKALDTARAQAAKLGGTLGEHLVASGAIGDDALTEFYRSRLLVPQVNPNSLAKLKTKVVAAIPADMAVELRAVPVAFDADGNLMVAMGDPSDRHAVDEITFFTGNYIVRAVATQMQIAWCLAHYYGHVTELGQRLLTPREDEPASAPDPAPTPAAPAPVAPAPQGSNPGLEVPRQRGDTARVDAARHRVLPPVTTPPPVGRPSGDLLDRSAPPPSTPPPTPVEATPTTPTAVAEPVATLPAAAAPAVAPAAEAPAGETPAAGAPAPDAPAADAAPALSPAGRSRSASGEIHVGVPREIGPETSDPEITITANVEEPTSPGMRVPRKRRSDPPELADRGGEIAARETGPKAISEEPRVVIDLQALAPTREAPIEASGEIPLPRTRAMSARMAAAPSMIDDEPSVRVVLEGDDAPAVIHDSRKSVESIIIEDNAGESAPILLERLRIVAPTDTAIPIEAADQAETDVVLLEARRPKTTSERRRIARQTQLGLGAVGRAGTGDERSDGRPSRDTEVGGLPPGADTVASEVIIIAPEAGTATEAPVKAHVTVTSTDDAVVITAAGSDETVVTTAAPDHGDDDDEVAPPPVPEDTGKVTAAPEPDTGKSAPAPEPDTGKSAPAPEPDTGKSAPAPEPDTGKSTVEGIEPAPDDVTRPLAVPDATRTFRPDPGPADDRITDAFDAIAAPPEPAAAPGPSIDHDPLDDGWGPPGTTIPPPLLAAAVDDSAPVARIPISDEDSAPLAVAPAVTRTSPADAGMFTRELEAAATRLVVVLGDIDRANGRNEVIYNLIAHLGETHNRAAFFAVKNGVLSVFSVRAPSVAQPRLTMSLDNPSTFQDVVGTRLPYRGPVVDEPTRQFLQGLLGNAPAEMLVLPVCVRDRVVGILYADGRRRHTFDDHYAIAARAAGLALERILKTKRP